MLIYVFRKTYQQIKQNMCHDVQNTVLCMVVRALMCLVDSVYEHVASKESVPSGLGTALSQHMSTPVPAFFINNVMECVQAFHDLNTCVMTHVTLNSSCTCTWGFSFRLDTEGGGPTLSFAYFMCSQVRDQNCYIKQGSDLSFFTHNMNSQHSAELHFS